MIHSQSFNVDALGCFAADNIFAILQQFLSKVSWTHALETIIDYMDNYLKIMGFVKQKQQDKILTVQIEELNDRKELISKKLNKYSEIEWKYKE